MVKETKIYQMGNPQPSIYFAKPVNNYLNCNCNGSIIMSHLNSITNIELLTTRLPANCAFRIKEIKSFEAEKRSCLVYECKSCKHEFENNFYMVKAGKKKLCSKCGDYVGNKGKTVSEPEFVAAFNAKYGEEYEVCSSFIGSKSPIRIRHKVCRSEFTVSRANRTTGAEGDLHVRCKQCFDVRRTQVKTLNEINAELMDATDGEFFISSKEDFTKSVNNKTRVNVVHTMCGITCPSVPRYIIAKTSHCKYCSLSIRARDLYNVMAKYTTDIEIEFNPQVSSRMTFDFYLPEFDILVEYDGTQHFKPTSMHVNVKEHDEKRNTAAINNLNKLIIRIDYTNDDVTIHQLFKRLTDAEFRMKAKSKKFIGLRENKLVGLMGYYQDR